MSGGAPNGLGGLPFGGLGQTPSAAQMAHQQQLAAIMHQQMMAAIHAQNMLGGGSSNWSGSQSIFNTSASVFAGQNAPSQPNWLKPDPKQPDTLGWREWIWSEADQRLQSPSQKTVWPEAELVVPAWDDGEAVRGVSGVHAHLVPKHWKILGERHREYAQGPDRVHGIVERFGKYVLGTEGWRAEWVIIRELMAPSTEIGLKLEQAYPDVIIHYPDEEEDLSCISVKSSKSGKGSRHTPRPRPSPLSSLLPLPTSSLVSQQSTQIAANLQLSQSVVANSNPLSLSLGANQPSPSRSESSRKVRWRIYDCLLLAAGVGFFTFINWVLS